MRKSKKIEKNKNIESVYKNNKYIIIVYELLN